MSKKYLYRGLAWSLLVIVLSIGTLFAYRFFITNSIIEDIEAEKQIAEDYDGAFGKIKLLETRINNYNKKIIEDNQFESHIPSNLNMQDILLDYVERPLLLANAKLINVVPSEGMPKNIKWSNNNNSRDIKGVKISINFYVSNSTYDADINTFVSQLQNSVRLVYISSINYNVPSPEAKPEDQVRVTMEYYLFYKEKTN